MSSDEVDTYLAGTPDPQRSTLATLRRMIAEVVPEAEEGIAYGAPAFRLGGKAIAGFSAAKKHVSYLPHSGAVLSTFAPEELAGCEASKGALKMPVDRPIPADLVRELVARRRAEAGV